MGKHVSVTLGTIEPLAFFDNINSGKTALICEGGGQRGILLRVYWMSFLSLISTLLT